MKGEFKIIEHKPFVSDHEIESFKDFNALLEKHSAEVRQSRVKGKLKLLGLAASIVVGLGIIYLLSNKTFPDQKQQKVESSPDRKPVTGVTVAVPDSVQSMVIPDKKLPKRNVNPPQTKNIQEEEKPLRQEAFTSPKTPTDDKKISGGYVPAVPKEGYDRLYEYFNTELQYPNEALADSVEGTLEIAFVITSKGKVEDIRLQNSLSELLDAEAMRIIRDMPAWTPATINGKPIESKMVIPLMFNLSKK